MKRMVRLYFISNSGAMFCDVPPRNSEAQVVARVLRVVPNYRQCSLEEYQEKRRWQEREDAKVAMEMANG